MEDPVSAKANGRGGKGTKFQGAILESAKADQAAKEIPPRHYKALLPVALTAAELEIIDMKLAETVALEVVIEAEKKALTSEINGRLKKTRALSRSLAADRNAKVAMRDVACIETAELGNGMFRTVRTDTGEYVVTLERAMSFQDRQAGLPFDDGDDEDSDLFGGAEA